MTDAAVHMPAMIEDDRTGLGIETLRRAFADNLYYVQGKFPKIATNVDYYMALAYTVRDRLLERWLNSIETYIQKECRMVCYLSAEFLLGPHLGNNLINLGIYEKVEQAVRESGLDLKDLLEEEEEPGLGNGGLGRLAACYMDSLATLDIPAVGFGIRYEFGIFDQVIRDGWQVEITDKWLKWGNPWEIRRPETQYEVKFGGHTQSYTDEKGRFRVQWIPATVINGIAYDTPILGYKTNNANTLRLWKAEATESFDFQAFNVGDYVGAVHEKMVSENITKVLYPNDESWQGKQLRLEQQYFFVSCSLQNVISTFLSRGGKLDRLHERFTFQMNDTHPSIGVAELMRLLVDVYFMDWETAWSITSKSFAFTNHTLLPEALEKWGLNLFGSLLPRHLEIIYEINRRFLNEVRAIHPGSEELIENVSLIDEHGEKYVRMANLACVGSHSINGVAALHTELLKSDVLKDFYTISPEKFNNKTNGVTPRRWIVLSNPALTQLITSKIGDGWIKDLTQLKQLEKFADDQAFQSEWRRVKLSVKTALAKHIKDMMGLEVDPSSLFDVQVKRLHEYKRQHLNVLNIIYLHSQLKRHPNTIKSPRTFIFGGKAAPGYFMAKLIIKLINSVAQVVNEDPETNKKLKVVFLPDYNVKFAQTVYPAADLSEQISTAGKEASGTGNMKLSMNGALTIGTLDGANVEIREEVGADNFFLFGLTADQVYKLKSKGYRPAEYYHANEHLKHVIDSISSGAYSHGDTQLFRPLIDSLMNHDDYCLFADFQSYVECQHKVDEAFMDTRAWTRMSILNAANMGKFSSDRSIQEYCDDIWKVTPVPVQLEEYCQSVTTVNVPPDGAY
jgi:glycogen phosphorylase